MKINKLKFILYCIFVLVYLIVFKESSNFIIKMGKNDNKIISTKANENFNDYRYTGSIINNVESFTLHTDNLKEYIQISGWAIDTNVSNKNNDKRSVSIIISSVDNNYECTTTLVFRDDAYEYLKINRNVYLGTSKKLGYKALVSSIMMKDGVYKIGIQIKENDVLSSMMWTNCMFEKKAGKLKEYNPKVPEIVLPVDTDFEGSYTALYDPATERFIVTGSIYKKGEISIYQQILILLKGNNGETLSYRADKFENLSLSHEHNDNNLTYSDFKCSIPLSSIKSGNYILSIVALNDNEFLLRSSD